MAQNDLIINRTLTIPSGELELSATRSSGPGGQHVNTSSTRVEVVWNVLASPTLNEVTRALLQANLANRLDREGRLRLVSSGTRSQLQNRTDVLDRLRSILRSALHVPKSRKATRVPRASRQRRLEHKRRRGALKARRRRPSSSDD